MEKLFDKSHAVLIGIGKFISPEITPLNTTTNDVAKIKEILTTHCGFDNKNIHEIIDENATLRKLKQFFEGGFSTSVGDNDRVVIYYSGHGVTREPHGRQPERGYFSPYDAEYVDDEIDWTTLFQLDQFVPFIASNLKARQLLFMFDCCFSGIVTQPPEYENQREYKCESDMIQAAKTNRSVQIFTSASKDEEVLASSGVSPPVSVFTEGIERVIVNLNPLNFPEGFASAHKLSKDITMEVRETSIFLKRSQNPVYYFSTLDDRGEFVLKQFTEDEISNAKENKKTKFEPIETLISK